MASRPVFPLLCAVAALAGVFLLHLAAGAGAWKGLVALLAASPLALGLAARASAKARRTDAGGTLQGRRPPPTAA